MKSKARIVLAGALLLAAAAVAGLEMHGSRKEEGIYQNRYAVTGTRGSFLMWQLERLWRGIPKAPSRPILPVKPDLDFIRGNRDETAITWVGHATLLLQLDGLNILTDPMFSDYASPIPPLGPKRNQPPGVALSDLPHIDVVLVSHNHYDHMDLQSLRQLALQPGGPPRFYVPLGDDAWFRDNVPGTIIEGPQRNVFAMNWDETETLPGRTADMAIHFLAVQHWSARTLWDRNETLWGSWALIHPKFRFWFSGDLGYSKDTVDIGRQFGEFDLAAIAIGAYEPRWFMTRYHVDPDEAVQVMKDVHARQAVGVHWGTFQMSDEPLEQPPSDLATAVAARGMKPDDFFVMRHGETRRLVAHRTPH
jgi:L-ascorbate metabolism protein UlaG (beta-lactamase superfamily)